MREGGAVGHYAIIPFSERNNTKFTINMPCVHNDIIIEYKNCFDTLGLEI